MPKSVLLSVLAFGLAASALPALAQSEVSGIVVEGYGRDVEVQSKVVSYADLDVSTHEGARVLFRRIRSAAEQVCSPDSGWSGELHADRSQMGCTEKAVTQALYRARIPALSYVWVSGRY